MAENVTILDISLNRLEDDNQYDKIKLSTKFYEKSLGLTPADLLIIEIKKPNRPITTKKNSIIRKNSRKCNKSIFSENNYKNPNCKDPKVRINQYNIYIRKYALY